MRMLPGRRAYGQRVTHVLVTGCAGFIGSQVTRTLLTAGHPAAHKPECGLPLSSVDVLVGGLTEFAHAELRG
jgi:hypothetical protein